MRLFNAIGKVEVEHEREYLELKAMFDAEGFLKAVVRKYGYVKCVGIFIVAKAPGACPLCKASREYFKREFLG